MITALGYYQRCIELCRAHGYGRIEVGNLYMVSWNRLYLNEVSGAHEDALAAIEAARRVGHDRAEMVARLAAGRVLVDRAEFEGAETHVLRGLELVESLGASRFQPFFAIYLGRIRFAQSGHRPETLRLMQEAVETSRQTGFGFLGPWVLGVLALVSDDPAVSDAALAQGEETLAGGGCVGHNYFDFYRHAMEVALRRHAWDRTDRYADALAAYTEPEPLPWCDYFIAWGRALAAHGRARSKTTGNELARLRNEAARLELHCAVPALADSATAG
jgi:tetratricopeptide (TPR) repeat protein